MGEWDTSEGPLDARRRFVRRLSDHEDVRQVNFSRDGFQLVLVTLDSEAEFREEWRQKAIRLGYTLEQGKPEASPPDWPENTWVLRLAETTESPDQTGWRATVQSIVTRLVQALQNRFKK
jgi:hypothetical protein